MAGRPAPDEEMHGGEVTVPRLAATVLLLRGGNDGLEVLLVRRTPRARFMAGAWVFPGGAVDPGDGAGQAGLRAAAIREVREEAGVELGPDPELVTFSNWITPAEVRIRFDTWFYLTAMPADQEPEVDGREVVDARWLRPSDALAAAAAGEMSIVFPTVKHLERIAGYGSAAELLAVARGLTVEPVQPRVIGTCEQARIVLPGEPGYDAD
ncbi:MAG TPA: NUDIX hydrolase [Solirubrobacteraceae bacterium]|jgi:8-oxo-dGTP pyrophosphatase MutT (NUDIX family)